MTGPVAKQGEIWFAQLDPVVGREQAGRRPALIVSVDALSAGPSRLAIVVPLTRTHSDNAIHVRINPPEGGLRDVSYALPEMVRSISRERLVERWGTARDGTLEQVLQSVHLLTRRPR